MNTNQYTKIQSRWKYFVFLFLYYALYPFCKLLYGRKENWLICERNDEAQDNGFVFFRYLVKNHPDINAIYLINKNCKQFEKVKNTGKTVEFGSVKHFLMVIGCPVKISSQLFGYAPWVQLKTFYRRNKTKDIHVFLQHGITKNDHEGFYKENCSSLKLFVCGGKPEYDAIKLRHHYSESDVPQYTGFARYDLLNDFVCKKQIIVMPTWRLSLTDASDSEFLASDFYKNWKGLMENNLFLQKSKHNGIDICFYLHHSFKQYSHLINFGPDIKFINFGEMDVQQILKESLLLITDFSSVFFDFAYMNKPIIFFQFDENTFYDKHYAKGYFDYRRDGFGDVCLSIDDVVHSYIKIVDNKFINDSKYSKRASDFFVYRDDKNCERIYESILRLQKNG